MAIGQESGEKTRTVDLMNTDKYPGGNQDNEDEVTLTGADSQAKKQQQTSGGGSQAGKQAKDGTQQKMNNLQLGSVLGERTMDWLKRNKVWLFVIGVIIIFSVASK